MFREYYQNLIFIIKNFVKIYYEKKQENLFLKIK